MMFIEVGQVQNNLEDSVLAGKLTGSTWEDVRPE
jgi:hypothetical protein